MIKQTLALQIPREQSVRLLRLWIFRTKQIRSIGDQSEYHGGSHKFMIIALVPTDKIAASGMAHMRKKARLGGREIFEPIRPRQLSDLKRPLFRRWRDL